MTQDASSRSPEAIQLVDRLDAVASIWLCAGHPDANIPRAAAREIERLSAALAAERDCRTCRNFRGTQHCHSVLRCVDGSSYKRQGVVQLWEAAAVDAGF